MKALFIILALVVPGVSWGEVLFQEPTGKALSNAIADLPKKDLEDSLPQNSGLQQYLMGLFYIHGAPEFHVAKSCRKAVSSLQNAWKNGVSDAAYTLSTMYYNGVCVSRDLEKSRELASESAEDGYILAQRMLGMAYVGKKWQGLYSYDVDKGVCWLSKAGNAGDRESAGQLSDMYAKGKQVKKDEKKSFLWLKKAVFNRFEDDSMVGFRALAESYEKGVGTEVDLIEAYKYYDLYGAAGMKGKQRVAKEMTQEQVNEALRQSKEWQKEHNVQVGGGFIRRAN